MMSCRSADCDWCLPFYVEYDSLPLNPSTSLYLPTEGACTIINCTWISPSVLDTLYYRPFPGLVILPDGPLSSLKSQFVATTNKPFLLLVERDRKYPHAHSLKAETEPSRASQLRVPQISLQTMIGTLFCQAVVLSSIRLFSILLLSGAPSGILICSCIIGDEIDIIYPHATLAMQD